MSIVNTEGLTVFGEGSEWFWTMAQFVIVAITLFGIYAQLKLARNANAFEQANRLTEEWHAERLARRRVAVYTTLAEQGPDADISSAAVAIGNFWENVAYLVRADHVEMSVVYERLSAAGRAWWVLLEAQIRRIRAEQDPAVFEHFEWLAGEFVRLDRASGVPDAAWTLQALLARSPSSIARERFAIAEFEAMRTVIVAAPSTLAATVPSAQALDDIAN
jgi:hypothetical protein